MEQADQDVGVTLVVPLVVLQQQVAQCPDEQGQLEGVAELGLLRQVSVEAVRQVSPVEAVQQVSPVKAVQEHQCHGLVRRVQDLLGKLCSLYRLGTLYGQTLGLLVSVQLVPLRDQSSSFSHVV